MEQTQGNPATSLRTCTMVKMDPALFRIAIDIKAGNPEEIVFDVMRCRTENPATDERSPRLYTKISIRVRPSTGLVDARVPKDIVSSCRDY